LNTLSGARVLVTGTAGFIGSHLVEALDNAGAEVHGTVRHGTDNNRLLDLRDRMHVHACDVTRPDDVNHLMNRVAPEIIFHLAAASTSGTTRVEQARVNVLGTACVLNTANDVGYDRFVHLGSALEYAPSPTPIRESHAIAPLSYRGVTKAAATLFVQAAARSEARPVVILRPFCVYGPRAREGGLIPTAIRATMSGTPIDLTAPGYRRDYVYIDDVTQACLLAAQAETAPGEVINVGTGKQYANEEVVDLIQAICGRRIEVRGGAYEARPYDQTSWVSDMTAARRLLGWTRRHELEEGLKKTVDFSRARL
jgi:nucleoside-diphosphate-sugar epimerase